MGTEVKPNSHFRKLKAAFKADGYFIENYVETNGKYGIRAASKQAINNCTRKPKLAYYLEGSPSEMGYQMGYLAEPEIALMTTIYVKVIPIDFIDPDLPEEVKIIIGTILDDLLKPYVKKLAASTAIPQVYKDQIKGILEGCQTVNSHTKVTLDGLELLNYGPDVLCAIVYEGTLPQEKGILPGQLRTPWMCNAFSLTGDMVVPGNHFFGRDFMFATGGIFQDTACMIIYNPDSTNDYNGIEALPSVVQSAPGMVGSVVSVNKNGVAMGVDMTPSHECNPDNVGLNSLLMVRHGVQYGKDADALVSRVKEATRGVSSLYPFADGSTGKGGVLETIKSIDFNSEEQLAKFFYNIPFELPASRIPRDIYEIFCSELKKYLPDVDFIKKHMQQFDNLKTGVFTRWSTYEYPAEYLEKDEGLWKCFNDVFELFLGYKYLHEDALGPDGFIDRYIGDKNNFKIENNCPGTWYFAPLRKYNRYKALVSNFFISPELRYTAMHYWTASLMLLSGYLDDVQWRYDELNSLIDKARKKGPIDKSTARDLINFLDPLTGPFPGYYANSPRCSKHEDYIIIEGSVSLCDLKEKSIESHFGYYQDKWVTITLPRYLE